MKTMMQLLAWAAGTLALWMAMPASGRAGPAPTSRANARSGTALTPQAKQEALPFFRRGNKLFGQGEYLDAVEAYRKAHSIYPSPKILGAIASCYDQLGRIVKALETYRRFLKETESMKNDPAVARNRKEAQKAVDRLIGQVSRLRVVVSAKGANLFVGDKPGLSTPTDRTYIFAPAEISVSVSKKGFYPFQKRVRLESGKLSTVKVVLLEAIKPKVVVKVKVKIKHAPPIWKKWWLWTAVGAVASGTALALGLWYGRKEVDESPDALYHDARWNTASMPVSY